ncbi:MAG: hypothetical protein NTU44_01900 [Bacteroidetes bacterium]|nr:hypothetical protein [Bacteroidota bacterium]
MKRIVKNISRLICGAGLLALVVSCEKKEMDPSSPGSPVLYIRGNFKDTDLQWTIGNTSVAGTTFIGLQADSLVRHFIFTAGDTVKPLFPRISFDFINYSNTSGNISADLDNTFTKGVKSMTSRYFNPANPYQLNTVTVEIADNSEYYSTQTFVNTPVSDSNFVRVDSVKDLTWKDGIPYKIIYLSFECKLEHDNPADSLLFNLKNGKAVIAFPRQ